MVVPWSSWKFARSVKKQQLKRKRMNRRKKKVQLPVAFEERAERCDRYKMLQQAVKPRARCITQSLRQMQVLCASAHTGLNPNVYVDMVSLNNDRIQQRSALLVSLLRAFQKKDWAKFDSVHSAIQIAEARIALAFGTPAC